MKKKFDNIWIMGQNQKYYSSLLGWGLELCQMKVRIAVALVEK